MKDGKKLWLFKSGDSYMACENLYPVDENGERLTLAAPAAIAIYRKSMPQTYKLDGLPEIAGEIL